eukprot:9493310-Pyramimonas_sp.AAC.1
MRSSGAGRLLPAMPRAGLAGHARQHCCGGAVRWRRQNWVPGCMRSRHHLDSGAAPQAVPLPVAQLQSLD